MFTIEYDPIRGKALPDALLVSTLLDMHDTGVEYFCTSNESIFHTARALIVENKIKHVDIQFKYKDTIISINKHATLASWPVGFCDTIQNFLRIIVKKNEEV